MTDMFVDHEDIPEAFVIRKRSIATVVHARYSDEKRTRTEAFTPVRIKSRIPNQYHVQRSRGWDMVMRGNCAHGQPTSHLRWTWCIWDDHPLWQVRRKYSYLQAQR